MALRGQVELMGGNTSGQGPLARNLRYISFQD
jgi:hypothetical protein